jgi:aryl-alcohol dehydrogenase-like predicted oxidoreductase
VIEQGPLGRTGLSVSRVCLGAMNFGGRTDRAEALQILDRALDCGVNFVDTANVYGHEPDDFRVGRGRSEEIIGAWLAGRRDDVVVATKVYFPMREAPGALGPSRQNVIKECEASLRRLRTEFIDLYQLHHPSNDVPLDETLRALDDLVTAGKVRYVGTSSFAAWQIVESLWVSSDRRFVRISSEQPVYNLLDRRIERELVPMALTHGLGLLTWSPLAGGVLARRYERDARPPLGSRHEAFWAGRQAALTDEVFDAVDQLAEVAAGVGLELHELAHAWVLQQSAITSVIVGPRTLEHLDLALAGVAATLSSDVLGAIDAIVPPGRAVLPQYGHDGMAWTTWGPHRHAWR